MNEYDISKTRFHSFINEKKAIVYLNAQYEIECYEIPIFLVVITDHIIVRKMNQNNKINMSIKILKESNPDSLAITAKFQYIADQYIYKQKINTEVSNRLFTIARALQLDMY